DKTFLAFVQDESYENYYKYFDKFILKKYRFKYLINNFYYLNYIYIRQFFFNLIKYYKLNVFYNAGIQLEDSLKYYNPFSDFKLKKINETEEVAYGRYYYPNNIELRTKYMNNIRNLYKNNLFKF